MPHHCIAGGVLTCDTPKESICSKAQELGRQQVLTAENIVVVNRW
ncbi:hypothetical protein [Pontibacter virosus]|nr:hypothetical protein [Pontibacter virosus]